MGKCFKVFGKAIKERKVVDTTGSAFFVAEHYLLTCKHTVSALSIGEKLRFSYSSVEYTASLAEVAENWDLALLYAETHAREEWIFKLDRVAIEGREAIAYGYPHGGGLDEQRGLKIGAELDNGVAALTSANGVTVGYSGGPVCMASDTKTSVGVVSTIKREDEYGHMAGTARFVPAHVALDLWGNQYGLREKRFEISTDAFGSNSFVFSELKTDFQDSEGYLDKLRGFVEDRRLVLWWAVVGPGGSGKSRLCYELARSLDSCWRCELLRAGQLKKDYLQSLYDNAGRDFLLLADYAYADTDELGEWMYERAHALDAMDRPRIRVLLLQREPGKDYFGWMESLLRRHGNLIKLRYQQDLKLKALSPAEIIALMQSYAEKKSGKQIDAEALYGVLQKVDPDLSRPLFAMFITDAVLEGSNPCEWKPEDALRHFTQREKDIMSAALSRPEDVRAAKLLLVLATITDAFTFDADLLNSPPLSKLWEFKELTDKAYFGSRLYHARLVDWENERYIMKPLKPDLLGEYYVLDILQEMMSDSGRREVASALLHSAKEADIGAVFGFLTRLFNDYETDEKFACLCCKVDDLFQVSVSMGLVMRQNTALLQKLYREFGTELWLEQYARGLYNAAYDQPDPAKAMPLLDELRTLHNDHSKNEVVAMSIAHWLYNAFLDKTEPIEALKILDELRALHKKQPKNVEVVVDFARTIVNAITNFSTAVDGKALLGELRMLHEQLPENIVVTAALAKGLTNAAALNSALMDEDAILNELQTLFMKEYENDEAGSIDVAKEYARCLFNALVIQSDSQKASTLLDKLRALYEKYPGNRRVSAELAKGLSNAIRKFVESMDEKAMLNELRTLYKDHPSNDLIAEELAKVLMFNTFNNQNDPRIACMLLNELRTLHSVLKQNIEDDLVQSTQNAIASFSALMDKNTIPDALRMFLEKRLVGGRITKKLAKDLVDAFDNQAGLIHNSTLLDELCMTLGKQPGRIRVAEIYSKTLSYVIAKYADAIDANPLLDELRELHKEYCENAEVTKNLAESLLLVLAAQTDQRIADAMLDEMRVLHTERPENAKAIEALSTGILNSFVNHVNSEKDCILLDELRALHKEQPGNIIITENLATVLSDATCCFPATVKGSLLEELRELRKEQPGNTEIVGALAKGLRNVIYDQTGLLKANALLDEIRSLHMEQSKNDVVAEELAMGLSDAIVMFSTSTSININDLLDELRILHKNLPRNARISGALAKSLFNVVEFFGVPLEENDLLNELRLLHKEQPGNAEVTGVLLNVLFRVFSNQIDMEKAPALLKEISALLDEQP